MRLLLFDIDGTLVKTGEAGLLAFAEVMREEFNAPDDLSRVDFAGATDSNILVQLFTLHGIPVTPENTERFRGAYFPALARWLPQRQGTLLPGVVPLLDALVADSFVQLALLTGNYERSARLKLEHYGVWSYFPFGAYADDSADRNALGPFALERARQHCQRDFDPAREVWIIGDTPKDIACARAIGARVLAVATGRHHRAELALSQPDVLCEDLTETAAVLQTLRG